MMMPMYMNYSTQPGQTRPQGGCYHQEGFGNYPPRHVTVDASSSSPASWEHWPTPSPCYGGCVHGNAPAYTPYWPPTPCYHPPQAPYHTCWGNHNHPGFYPHAPPCYIHQPFPVGYYQHGIESEKDVAGKNCCTKCSPQMSYPKNNGTGVVIEEHDEPDIEKGDRGEAVNHVRSTNCPYPIVWIPHDNNARKQEQGGSHNQHPAHVKVPETESKKVQKGDPKYWNGSFPLDENAIKYLMQNQDRNKLQNGKTVELPFDISKLKSLLQGQGQTQQNKEPGQLQYPIFWIPSQGKPENVEASEKKERGNEGSDLKSVSSSNHINNGPVSQCDKGNFEGSNVVSDAAEKSLVRNIPVESHKEPRNIPVKLLENHLPEPAKSIAKTEPAEETRKDKRPSPPKASRLPPVCLRVDPLPKRQNGKSKSLSPPRRKEQALTSEETKVASPPTSKMVETRTNCEKANKEKKTPEECPKPTGSEKESVETKSDLQGVKCEFVKPCEAKENEEKPAKKTFTEDEAARVIQSRFRGYDVRRWEPIKKLKEIASVREQMGDIKKRVQVLELSADRHTVGKEIVVLGEMVMSLLLKLDSVQGLHPSIRDFRKSLARELSDMQENIDSLKKSSVEEGAVEEQVDTTSQISECPVSLEHSQHAEENNMVSDTKTEKVCLPSPEEHLTSLENTIEGQPVAEAEEVTGFSETLAKDPEPAAETDICEAVVSTTIPEKIEAAEAVSPTDPSSADGNEMTVTNKEDKAIVENLEEALPQVVETTLGSENATEVSETVANEYEKEDRKGDDDSVLSSERIEAVENQSSADGNEITRTSIDDEKVVVEKVEEPVPELLQVMETAPGPHFKDQENATEVSETADNASENENEDDYILHSEKNEAVETVGPVNLSSADADEMTIEEDQVMVEKLEEPQVVVETTHGQALEGLENAIEVSETVTNVSDTEDRKGDDDYVLPSEKDVEFSELPAGVIDDRMQLLSQDSLSSPEAEKTVADPETASKEETNVGHSSDHSSGIGQETQVTEHEMSEETKKLMEENQRFKETMETLVKAGREQLEVISKLTGRVKSLEKKLSQKKRTHVGRRKPNRGKQTTKQVSASCTDAVM
ncbi:BAG family molecular chaperone regulator 6 [Raphanus sativus]|uniref:BAG family molecular chaperone regulator 6 n=1 Tax=Raphanus sativus TaxID=3726 RepID=A0A9W3BXB9_RAPSA|nr:BAG family molecular chaperone regulator 6 [Raphanus sativus]KAJ4892424.1 BAG family molecular chaperone regulator 6 [Raphanus sativus]